MGVPTTANYCIMASTMRTHPDRSSASRRFAAHFFVFYFGIVADITPPVALAAYAGSAIAKSNPMKTGLQRQPSSPSRRSSYPTSLPSTPPWSWKAISTR